MDFLGSAGQPLAHVRLVMRIGTTPPGTVPTKDSDQIISRTFPTPATSQQSRPPESSEEQSIPPYHTVPGYKSGSSTRSSNNMSSRKPPYDSFPANEQKFQPDNRQSPPRHRPPSAASSVAPSYTDRESIEAQVAALQAQLRAFSAQVNALAMGLGCTPREAEALVRGEGEGRNGRENNTFEKDYQQQGYDHAPAGYRGHPSPQGYMRDEQ